MAESMADALQNILARKEVQKRQALLDSITQQNADTNRMQTEAEIGWRNAQAEREQAIANKERLNDYVIGQKLSPEDKDWMGKAGFGGLIKDTPTGKTVPFTQNQDGSIDQGPVEVTESTYAGSPAEQKEALKQAQIKQLLSSNEFGQASPVGKYLLGQSLGLKLDPDMFRAPGSAYIFDQATGTIKKDPTIELPAGKNEFLTKTRPPIGPRETFSYFNETDPETGKDTGNIISISNQTQKTGTVKLPEGGGIGRRAGTNPPQVSAANKKPLWMSTLPALQKANADLGKAMRSEAKAAAQAQIAATRATAVKLYDDKPISDGFRNQLIQIVTNPAWAAGTTPQIISTLNKQRVAAGASPLTEDEIGAMNDLLPSLLGK